MPTFGAVWLIPRLAGFARQGPDVTFDLSATLSPVDFDSDPRDGAILRGAVARHGMLSDKLFDERLVVVAARGLLPDGAGPLDDAALARLPLLQQATRPNLWLDWFLDAGLDPITILRGARMQQFGMVLAAARAGLGVALVPEVLVRADLASGALHLASRRSMLSTTPYVLTYPERSLGIEAFAAFRTWLLDQAQATVA